jgi:ribonuclease PH
MRPARITPGYLSYAEGSALIELGETRVLCAVSVEERVPAFLKGKGSGWITAEYGMLPRATLSRTPRERGGRSYEIQRLIGRSLRAVANLEALGERSLIVDCDVLQADGGTRTAAITAAYVALHQAFKTLLEREELHSMPLNSAVAAISVGIVNGIQLLDLCYDEDSRAEVDFNVVMTDRDEFVEIQGAAEANPFPKQTIDSLLALAEKGIKELFVIQRAALEGIDI